MKQSADNCKVVCNHLMSPGVIVGLAGHRSAVVPDSAGQGHSLNERIEIGNQDMGG